MAGAAQRSSSPPTHSQGKDNKAELSHEVVWGVTSAEGGQVVVISTPVTKKFAVNLLYQGTPAAKPKMDFVVDSKAGDTDKLKATFDLLQKHFLALATDVVPSQSTNAYWKNKPEKIEDNLPKMLKPGKEYTKDGVSGQYDPSFTLSIKVPNESDLAKMADKVAAYELPPLDSISKGYNDSAEAYASALRKLPPTVWDIKVKNSNGETVPNNVLLEKRSIVAQVMFQIDSLMIKPLKTLSIQMPIRQMTLCDVASNKRRLNDEDLDALWKPAKAQHAEKEHTEPLGEAGAASDDDY